MTAATDTRGSPALVVGVVTAIVLVALETLGLAAAMPVISDELDGEALYGAVFSAFYLAQVVAIAVAGHLTGRRPAPPSLRHRSDRVCDRAARRCGCADDGGPRRHPCRPRTGGRARRLRRLRDDHPLLLGRTAAVVLAYVSSAWVAPAFVAPPLAGYLAEEVSWRWVFAGVVPLVPVVAGLAIPPLRRVPSADDSPLSLRGPLTGGVVTAAGIGLGQLALARPERALSVSGTALGVGLTVAGLRRLLPRALRTLRTGVGTAAALKLLLAAGFFGVHYFLPVALTDVQGLSAAVAGLILTVGSATWTVGAVISTRFLDRLGPRLVALSGCGFLLVGTAAMYLILDPDLPAAVAFPLWAVAAIGMGLAFKHIKRHGDGCGTRRWSGSW